MSKILITGGSGRMGKGLLGHLDFLFNPDDVVYLLKHQNPLALPQNSQSLAVEETDSLNERYDFALHLAATTDTKRCKDPSYRDEARQANVELTRRVCDASDSVLLFSSIHVFKGDSDSRPYTETDELNPCDFYGETKAEAEEVAKQNERNAIIRLGQTIGVQSRIVDESVVRAIQTGDYFPYWTNVVKQLSDIHDIIEAVRKIYFKRVNGIYHIGCNEEAPSQAQIADITLSFWKSRGWPSKVEDFKKEQCHDSTTPRRLVFDTAQTQSKLRIDFRDAKHSLTSHLISRYPS